MSFFKYTTSEHVAARVTNFGRQKIAEGNFNIKYFQFGDSEFDYNFPELSGTTESTIQKVFTPLDKYSSIKHPYQFSLSGTTYGTPIKTSQIHTIKNFVGDGSCDGFIPNPWKYVVVDNVTNQFASIKSFLGYTTSLGQVDNTTTTVIVAEEPVVVLPEDQASIVILFYDETSTELDPDAEYMYEDYIYGDYEYFLVTDTNSGNQYTMDKTEHYISSPSVGSKQNRLKFRYLINVFGVNVGKIFVDNKIIVFDNPTDVALFTASPGVVTEFNGTVNLVRATDIQILRFLINLPDGQFETTQNPTYPTNGGTPKRITEVVLLDENKEILVVGKLPKPVERVGTQVISIKIDF